VLLPAKEIILPAYDSIDWKKVREHYYSYYNANVHRGVHTLSQEGTTAFEASRNTVKEFINASKTEEVIFTKGTTNSINLLAYSWGRTFIQAGDEILISTMEHHSNIVPWQILCEEKKAALKVIPIHENGELIWEDFLKLLSDKTKLISVVHVSNALGTINPVKNIIEEAHKRNICVHLDGAQAAPHMEIDVQELDCDFYSFSGHKMFAPTGMGILYGKEKWLEQMPPFEGGGEMIKTVSFQKTTYNDLPFKFEAGTPNIEAAIVLADAIRYIQNIGIKNIATIENKLLD
jgi:cysteine desulfurase/selenocysteine lyase